MYKVLFFSALAMMFVGCNNDKNEKQSFTTKQLIGEWNNLSMKVETISKDNSDSNEVLEVDRKHWEEKLKIKPIRTFFRADSTYNSAHYNLDDSLVYNPSGRWWIDGDKLVMLQTFPAPDTSDFILHINGDIATFEGLVDWDMDGKKDDKYFGQQLKINAVKK